MRHVQKLKLRFIMLGSREFSGNYTFTLNAALSAGGVAQSQTTVTVTIQ